MTSLRCNNDWEEWDLSDECKDYWRERLTWQQIIVEEGVTTIPENSFMRCFNIQRVVFADTVIRIGEDAFNWCKSLVFVKFPMHLECIGGFAFFNRNLSSVFIPPRCSDVGHFAFSLNENLAIFNVLQHTEIGDEALFRTTLLRDSPFKRDDDYFENVHNWIKNINNDEKYTLNRACSSFRPLDEIIHNIIETRGIGAFTKKNKVGVTSSQYLNENPYSDVKEMDVIRGYVMKMMGLNTEACGILARQHATRAK